MIQSSVFTTRRLVFSLECLDSRVTVSLFPSLTGYKDANLITRIPFAATYAALNGLQRTGDKWTLV